MLQNAFSRSIHSGARRAEAFATRPSNGSWASSCAERMQKERVKMMIVAACASVGRGPSDARPEHYHGRGPEPSVGFNDTLQWRQTMPKCVAVAMNAQDCTCHGCSHACHASSYTHRCCLQAHIHPPPMQEQLQLASCSLPPTSILMMWKH